jgi:hypothetical protein
MIKRFKNYVKENLENNEMDPEMGHEMDHVGRELEIEEEGGDIYSRNLEELASMLGAEIVDNEIIYNDMRIIFPSETEMFHVNNKKFKTAQEAFKHIKSIEQRPK